MQIRLGVESARAAVLDRVQHLGAPILVSANSLWDNGRRRFSGWQSYHGFDTALDSGGFVAMRRYGGYRWTVPQYVQLAGAMRPTWWAQMDFCCEPQLAADRAAVRKRIHLTAHHLRECQAVARDTATPDPVPVLQGWHPLDYCRGPLYETDAPWPALVGIGSVCRRHVHGPDGILAVVDALHQAVPPHVQFHLFGVKSTALALLQRLFPARIASTDSMAWRLTAHWEAVHRGLGNTHALDADVLAAWYERQRARLQTSVTTL